MGNRIKLDIAFIVDTTGSMGGFIHSCQRFLSESVKRFETSDVDMRCSLIVYRDHPPQARSFASKILLNAGTSADVTGAMQTSAFMPNEGGDEPESGLDAINDLSKINFREGSIRYAFIAGDAPLHGTFRGNEKCACGLTPADVKVVLEEMSVILVGVPLRRYTALERSFETVVSTNVNVSGDPLKKIVSEIDKVCAVSRWSVNTLFPVLEADPFQEGSKIAKELDVSTNEVSRGIEVLNLMGLTSKFI